MSPVADSVPQNQPKQTAKRPVGRPPKSKYARRKCNSRRGPNLNEDGTRKPRPANVLLESEILIDEIRQRKALWQRTHDQHHSHIQCAPLWNEIAKILDTSPHALRRRWKSLKDHYRRELKKSITDASAPPSPWPYYKKMRFMKSQMFVSLRRQNGEDHLEILSDDEGSVNGEWNGPEIPSKLEGGSDTMDAYDMSGEYEMVKYEQQMNQMSQEAMNGVEEDEEQAAEETDQQQQQQEQDDQEDVDLTPIPTLNGQDDLSELQQQQEENLSNLPEIQQPQGIPNDMSTMTTISDHVGGPSIVTTTASSLNGRRSVMQQRDLTGRLSSMQQQTPDLNSLNTMHHTGRLSSMQQTHEINDEISETSPRQNVIQQQRVNMRSRMDNMTRNVEMNAMPQRTNLNTMQQGNSVISNGIDNSNIFTTMIGDDRNNVSDDYHFFMSLLPHIRHFSSLQKLKIRNRIQQIIIEEVSSAQYDPLGNC
ncbi:hypothetical protein QAD02_015907 [Eretmocerus hayati]|uniref:Uncharacterized protein n=1 Tax=Eretmocerus hayati TaxID=131215 RepID=A0ACC2P9P7_9HYME|nr:hypothetical protein QAD02_015907 [Eretmocerus hayati]